MPTSPNWTSRSTSSVRSCRPLSSTARLTASDVFPVPPFVDETMITLHALACPLARPRAALCSANEITSGGCGRMRMSASDDSSASSTRPSLCPTSPSTIGASVCFWSAATSLAIGAFAPVTCRTTSALSIGVRPSVVYSRMTRSRRPRSAGSSSRAAPVRRTTILPRARPWPAVSLAAIADAPLAEPLGELEDLRLAQAVAEERRERLDAVGAVERIGHRPQHEPPVRVLHDEEELLRIGVGDRERDRGSVGLHAADHPAPTARTARRREHEQVAQDDAGCDEAQRLPGPDRRADAVVDVRENVDVISVVHQTGEQLVTRARKLECPHRSGDLTEDALLRERLELLDADLLAFEDRLRRDEPRELLRGRDRARHDVAPEHRLGLEVAAQRRSRRARRDVSRRHQRLHETGPVLHVLPVAREVDEDEQRPDHGEAAGEEAVSQSVTGQSSIHSLGSSTGLVR